MMDNRYFVDYSTKTDRFETGQLQQSTADPELRASTEHFFETLSVKRAYSHLSRRGPITCMIVTVLLLFILGLAMIIVSTTYRAKGNDRLKTFYDALDNDLNRNDTETNNTSPMTSNNTVPAANTTSLGNTTSNGTNLTSNGTTNPTTNATVNSTEIGTNTTVITSGNQTNTSTNQTSDNQTNQSVRRFLQSANDTDRFGNTTANYDDYHFGTLYIRTSNAAAVAAFIFSLNFVIILIIFIIFSGGQKRQFYSLVNQETAEIAAFVQRMNNRVAITPRHEKKRIGCCKCFWIMHFRHEVFFRDLETGAVVVPHPSNPYVAFDDEGELNATNNDDFATNERMPMNAFGLDKEGGKEFI
jgi:hypothetical protein